VNKIEYYAVGLFNSEITIYNTKFEQMLKLTDTTSNKDEHFCELLHDILFFELTKNTILVKASRNEEDNLLIYSIDTQTGTYKPFYTFQKKETEYVNCLSSNPVDFTYFCAGDTEGNIHVFKIPELAEEKQNKTKKKRKIQIDQIAPETTIDDVTSEKKQIKWINNQQILSSGDDFIIKLWNVHTKTAFSHFNTNHKYVTCLCPVNNLEGKFLSGHEDGSVKLWDPKVNTNVKPVLEFSTAHSNFVSDLCMHPDLDNHANNFSSVGYDGKLKLWDLRSNKTALFDMMTESEKNYSVCYNSSKYLMCGGDSSSVSIYENKI